MPKIAMPISHLFKNTKYRKVLMEHSDCLELRENNTDAHFRKIEIFHSEIQPIHKLHQEEVEYLEKIKARHLNLKLITFHCGSSCDEPYIENGIFKIGGNSYKRQGLLKNAKINFEKIRRIFGKNVKIGIENNNYYPTQAYRHIANPDFIKDIVYANDLSFVFDIAHARITAHNRKIDYLRYKERLPLDKLVQLHISSYDFRKNGLAYDAHDYPAKKEFTEVKIILNTYALEYLTIEYYKDVENLVSAVKILRRIINGRLRETF